MPAPSQRPYGGDFDEVADALDAALGEQGVNEAVESVVVDRDEMTLHVRREHLLGVCRVLRDDPDLRFELCSNVSGVHYPHDVGRELHAVYHLLSITHNRRVRLETACPDADPHIPSVVEVYPTADWQEREAWDFFGIVFDGHPALTRIQMPDDWPGHPQRKDYPAGRHPGGVQGRHHSAARHEEVVQLMSETTRPRRPVRLRPRRPRGGRWRDRSGLHRERR